MITTFSKVDLSLDVAILVPQHHLVTAVGKIISTIRYICIMRLVLLHSLSSAKCGYCGFGTQCGLWGGCGVRSVETQAPPTGLWRNEVSNVHQQYGFALASSYNLADYNLLSPFVFDNNLYILLSCSLRFMFLSLCFFSTWLYQSPLAACYKLTNIARHRHYWQNTIVCSILFIVDILDGTGRWTHGPSLKVHTHERVIFYLYHIFKWFYMSIRHKGICNTCHESQYLNFDLIINIPRHTHSYELGTPRLGCCLVIYDVTSNLFLLPWSTSYNYAMLKWSQ